MVINTLLVLIIFIGFIIGSITDLKKREVPDWVNYGLISLGLGIRLLYSVATFDWFYFFSGLAGFLVFLAIAYAMFYAGQWGGGDSKLLMALGALIGLDYTTKIPLLFIFLINALVVGAVYGVVWSLFLIFQKWNAFLLEFKQISKSQTTLKRIFLGLLVLIIILVIFLDNWFVRAVLLISIAVTFFMLYVWIFSKAVETVCMVKTVGIDKLTEGDWIYKDVRIDGKRICGPKDLGITKEQIELLNKYRTKGKISRITIKQGIPFVPSFFMAYILMLLIGNWLMLLI